jgi:hypothetical protein
MTLGIALVVVFTMYLIDKHNRWRIAGKVLLGLVILAALGFGAVYEYDAYETRKYDRLACAAGAIDADCPTQPGVIWDKPLSRQQVIQQIENCLAKSTPAGNLQAAEEQRHQCEQHPDQPVVLVPLPVGAVVEGMFDCYDKNGKLIPDDGFFEKFGGRRTGCAPGQIQKPHVVK